MNLEFTQDFSIFYFSRRSPETPDSLYLNVVGIPPSPRRIITKKVDLCNYNENDEDDKYKWEVDYDGGVGPFFDDIEYEKEFDYYRENHVSMGGEGHVEV